MATEAVENYLKTIFALSQESPTGDATISRIAALVGVTPSTATTMVKKLAAARLAKYQKYGAVTLTSRGSRAALDVLRRHRIVEQFLVDIVGLDWSEVHQEAERLEHVISPRLLDRLDEMLGRPKFDPHGDPIPDAAGRSAPARLVPLSRCDPGDVVVIGRIRDQEAEFLQFVARTGLRPGSSVTVERVDALAGAVVLKPRGHPPISVSLAVADKVLARAE